MKRLLFLSFVYLLLASCGKDNASIPKKEDPKAEVPKDKEEEKQEPANIDIIEVKQAHVPIATGQESLLYAILKENLPGARFSWKLSYKGKVIDNLSFAADNSANLLTKSGPGEYTIDVSVEYGDRKGSFTQIIEVVPVDFGVGAWGNSDSVIRATKKRVDYVEPETGLRGMHWLWDTDKPSSMRTYKVRTDQTENYLFENNKLVAGYHHVTENFVSYAGTIERNYSYGMYMTNYVSKIDEIIGKKGIEDRAWTITEDRREAYENHKHGADGIGWAMLNGYLKITTKWEADRHHAISKINALSNNSRYEIIAFIKDAKF